MLVVRERAKRLGCQIGPPRPSIVRSKTSRAESGRFAGQELSDLAFREREVASADLQKLAASAEPVDAKRQLCPRGEDEMQARRRLAAQALEQARRGVRAIELLHVLHDDNEVATEALRDCFA